MKTRTIVEMILIAALLTIPFVARGGESLTGRIVGHGCVHEGHVCPVDRLDPHIALEPDFVLVVKGGDYYFMPNLSRGIKMRYVLETVTVNGDLSSKHNAIVVDELIAEKGGKQRTVWSKQMQSDEARYAWGGATR